MRKAKVKQLVTNGQGIMLDVGCGAAKSDGWIGMDKRALPGVDLVHDLETFPYPLPDACAHIILASHILEHIKPWFQLDVMDELWRIMKPNGQLCIALPYAGSPGYYQDPTHCCPWNEATPLYYDPDYGLYQIYQPKPWRIIQNDWVITGNMEIRLMKRPLETLITSEVLAGQEQNV